jgi:hypothetical protein
VRRVMPSMRMASGCIVGLTWKFSGAHFMGLVHHTDAEREFAYDRTSSIGHFDKALDEAKAKGWAVVSMHLRVRVASRYLSCRTNDLLAGSPIRALGLVLHSAWPVRGQSLPIRPEPCCSAMPLYLRNRT